MNFFGACVDRCPGVEEEELLPPDTRLSTPMDLSETPAIMPPVAPRGRMVRNGLLAAAAAAAGITYIWG